MIHLKRLLICLLLFIHAGIAAGQNDASVKLKKDLLAAKPDTAKVRLLLDLSIYYLNSEPEQAKQYGLQALQLSINLSFQQGRAKALKNIGSAYYFEGNTIATLDYFGQCLQVYDTMGDLNGQAILYNNFGTVYYMNGTDDKALENYFKSLEIAERIADKAVIASAYSNIGNVYNNKRSSRQWWCARRCARCLPGA